MKTARLKITTKDGDKARVRPSDLIVELNGVEFPLWRNIRLAAGVDEGVTRVSIDFYVNELEVDADVVALMNDLNTDA